MRRHRSLLREPSLQRPSSTEVKEASGTTVQLSITARVDEVIE
jgi:hypothetical protein